MESQKIMSIKKGLFWSMGAGKTRASIDIFNQTEYEYSVVIAPKILHKQWQEEIKNYYPDLENRFYFSTLDGLEKFINAFKDFSIDKAFFICDEAHKYFNNDTSKRFVFWYKNIAQKLKENQILLLTGTPVTRNESNFYCLHKACNSFFYSAEGKKLKSKLDFQHYFMNLKKIYLAGGRSIDTFEGLKPHRKEEFNAFIDSFWSFKEIDFNIKIAYKTHEIEQSTEFSKVYEDIKEGILQIEGEEKYLNYIIQSIYAIRFLSCGYVKSGDNYIKNNNLKLNCLLDIIKKSEDSIIVFCPFVEIRKFLLEELSNLGYLATSDSNLFQEKQGDIKILVTSTEISGAGLNLQFCNEIVFYASDYSSASRKQAEARIIRRGQKRNCYIHDLVIQDSYEKNILQIIEKKDIIEKDIAKSIAQFL